MADLTVTYMGLKLKNPVIAGASGLTSNLGTIKKIEDAGAGAVVCKSLFEEEIMLEAMAEQKDLHQYDEINAEMISMFPDIKDKGPGYHLYWLKKTKEALNIPVIASLNAVNKDVWIEYAKLIEQTGVDGIELNLYSSPDLSRKNSTEIEDEQLALLKNIRKAVSLPLSVKLSPYYTNPGDFIQRIDAAGINGFVLFNRFFQSNINIENEEITFPFTFSDKADNRMSLRYAGMLAGHLKGSVCTSTGIMDEEDVIRMLLTGADTVQVVSTLYKNGMSHISGIVKGIEKWMDKKGYSTIEDFRGKMSWEKLDERSMWVYKRSQYVKILMQNSKELMKKIM